uniref:Uncharacterized protein n=1 Tax=Arundo donax TaxID=35708 RepID=A0A0A8XU99_ARUDO
MKTEMAKAVIFRLDAQEHRALSMEELMLRKRLFFLERAKGNVSNSGFSASQQCAR